MSVGFLLGSVGQFRYYITAIAVNVRLLHRTIVLFVRTDDSIQFTLLEHGHKTSFTIYTSKMPVRREKNFFRQLVNNTARITSVSISAGHSVGSVIFCTFIAPVRFSETKQLTFAQVDCLFLSTRIRNISV